MYTLSNGAFCDQGKMRGKKLPTLHSLTCNAEIINRFRLAKSCIINFQYDRERNNINNT